MTRSFNNKDVPRVYLEFTRIPITLLFALILLCSFSSVSQAAYSPSDTVVVNGKGYGHGVGLSMNGVQHLAEGGSTYPTILKKYYTGVTVSSRPDLMPSKIKVGLYATTGTITVTANGGYNVYNYRTGSKIGSGSSGGVSSVSYSGGTYTLKLPGSTSSQTYSDPIKFTGTNSSVIMQVTSLTRMSGSTNMNQYRGSIIAQYSANSGSLWAINELGVNEYLYGLAEEPDSWPTEAQKTLALASRTYAVEKVKNPNNRYKVDNYDMCPSACQYYLGFLAERPNFRKAVDATASELITHPQAPYQVIIAAYSANSGGYTEHNENVWIGMSSIPYLRGVPDSDSETGAWAVSYKVSDLQAKLDASSSTAVYGNLLGFRIDKVGVSGRVVYMTIIGSEGDHTNVSGPAFQGVLGLRSSFFTIGGTVAPPADTGAPVFTSVWVTPNPFSPNGDKTNDTTSFAYTLDRQAKVTIKINNYKGEVKSLITGADRAAGRFYEGWTGTDNTGHVLPNGTYSYTTTGLASNGKSTTVKGTVTVQSSATVTPPPAATGAPALTSVWMHPNPFYPRGTNTALKTTSFCFSLNTTANVTIKVFDYKGEVRTVISSASRAGGRHYEGWTGTNNTGQILPPGNYRYTIEAKNSAGTANASGITSIR